MLRPSKVSLRRSSRGQSIVEFALVLPVLLLLMLIAIDFGRIYLGWVNLQQMARIAANDAADHASAWGTPGDPAEQTRYRQLIANDTAELNCDPQNPIPDPIIAGGTALGAQVTVGISCEFHIITPIISNILGGTVLVSAETTFPIKEGAVATVPGGGVPIIAAPTAKFNASPQTGWAPLNVTFTDTSIGTPTSWIWDYAVGVGGTGTGSVSPGTSITQGPRTVAYGCTGSPGDTCTFGVSLTVANAGGSDQKSSPNFITVTVPPATGPIAEFTGSPLSGVEPVTTNFQFVDLRAGAVTYTSYQWDFTNDGTFDATGTTASHTYATSGAYSVTLKVTDNTGATNTLTKTGYVNVGRRLCTVPDFFNVRQESSAGSVERRGFHHDCRVPAWRQQLQDQVAVDRRRHDRPAAQRMRVHHHGGTVISHGGRLRRTRSKGQAMVELALVLPVALLLLMAVFDFGRAIFVYNGLTNAAREGARLAIVNQDEASVSQRVQEMAFGGGLSNAGDPNLVNYYKQEPNLANPTSNPQCTTIVTGCIAVVTAKVSWTAITPIIGSIIGPINFTARSELPIELVCPNPTFPSYATADLCPKQP